MTDDPRILPQFAKVRREALAAVDKDNNRTLACARCGGGFGCNPVGACWCGSEDFKLPVPLPGKYAAFGDCLCPGCLREIAAELRAAVVAETGGKSKTIGDMLGMPGAEDVEFDPPRLEIHLKPADFS